MRARTLFSRGFTIVELLVVLAVISILTGLILAGLRSAVSTANKTKEGNLLKGYHAAWQAYSNTYEALLPGFLDPATQQSWNVSYKNTSNVVLSRELTQTYPWRLAGYFDGNMSALIGYRDVESDGPNEDLAVDWSPNPALPTWMQTAFTMPGSAVALQPAFGYNAYYLGGWYTNNGGVSVPDYLDAPWTSATGSALTGRIVSQTEAQISRPSQVTVFASSTFRPANLVGYKAGSSVEDYAMGSAWVVPSYLGSTQVWSIGSGTPQGIVVTQRSPIEEFASMFAPAAPSMQDSSTLVVYVDQSVPLRRFNRQAAVVHADGSVASSGANELLNMEHWIGSAWKPDFRHGP
ncbi:MAG: type II secretion system protein [Phycisphaerae bacterium]|nr:type II secretion system protein [Phycisphaerae bacterium]